MHVDAKTRLRNIVLVVIVVVQVGLACYVVWNSKHSKSVDESALLPPEAPQKEELDDAQSLYKKILLHGDRIDASEWKVGPEFFRLLSERSDKDIRYLALNRSCDDQVISYLTGLNISQLILMDTHVTRSCLSDVSKIASLGHLEISGLKLTKGDVETLMKLPLLSTLRAYRCGLTDDSLRILGARKFYYLRINGNKEITDSGVTALGANCPTIIALGGTAISDLTAAYLSHHDSVQSIELYRDRITDKSWHYFARLKHLRSLNLNGTLVTDKGLKAFKPPSSLKFLHLSGCAGVSEPAIEEFRNRYPGCTVTTNDKN